MKTIFVLALVLFAAPALGERQVLASVYPNAVFTDHAPASAPRDSQFYFGGGSLSTTNADCSLCDSSGGFVEIGHDINAYFGSDIKYARTEMDDLAVDLDMLYVGLNIGPDLGQRFRVYAKLGLARIQQEGYGYKEADTSAAFGIGFRLIPFKSNGFYLKAERVRAEFASEDVDATTVGLGFVF